MNFKCIYFDNFDVILVHFCLLESEDKEDIGFSGSFLFFEIPKDSDRALRSTFGNREYFVLIWIVSFLQEYD